MSGPQTTDGRQVVVTSPGREGWLTFYTGAGDGEAGRGKGDKIRLSFTGPETKAVEWTYGEPVEVHDGELFYTGAWCGDDRFTYGVLMPATVATPNGGGTGNANVVDAGGYGVIVPSFGGPGGHDVDLATAVPVPALSSDGYWDVDYATGAVSVSATPGAAEWHLFDVELFSPFIANVPMGNPLGVFDVDSYKAEWLSERWKMRLSVTRVSEGAGEVSGWLMLFRRFTT